MVSPYLKNTILFELLVCVIKSFDYSFMAKITTIFTISSASKFRPNELTTQSEKKIKMESIVPLKN